MGQGINTLSLELDDKEALALAQFVKRLTWSDLRGCAVDDDEAYVIKDAVDKLGVVSENGIYGHSRFCNTDFDDKLACLNLSGV